MFGSTRITEVGWKRFRNSFLNSAYFPPVGAHSFALARGGVKQSRRNRGKQSCRLRKAPWRFASKVAVQKGCKLGLVQRADLGGLDFAVLE